MKKNGFVVVIFCLVLVFGFAAVSCGGGGGNINKVKNGVFKDYDASITVGKALENNSTLKGGKWATVEMDGRNYVTYTVKFTAAQTKEFLGSRATGSQPNLEVARKFELEELQTWRGYGSSSLSKVTTLTAEEVKQASDIFHDVFYKRQHQPFFQHFFDPFDGGLLKDEYYGQWFLENKANISYSFYSELNRERINGILNEYDATKWYSETVRYWVDRNASREDIQNGILAGETLRAYRINAPLDRDIVISNEAELQHDIAATMAQLLTEYEKAREQYELADAEYKKMRDADIEPLVTFDGLEIIVSFLMNTDGTFTPNMVESTVDITMNCLDNLKASYGVGSTSSNSAVLGMIYRSFTPKIL